MQILDTLRDYLAGSGFGQFHWSNGVMILVGLFFIFLAVRKKFEPLLLVPIGFGILIGNIPYDSSKLSLGVYDGPVAEHDLDYYQFEIDRVHLIGADAAVSLTEALDKLAITKLSNHTAVTRLIEASQYVTFKRTPVLIELHHKGREMLEQGQALLVNKHSVLSARRAPPADSPSSIVAYGQGRHLFVLAKNENDRYPEMWNLKKQDPHGASVFWWLFTGVGLAGFYPPLIFLGIGALTDFGPMLSNRRTLLLGAAAQFGIFASLLGALALGFTLKEAASIGIIGGADGPTAIFTCSRLAPDLLGPVALAAYSYMALVPLIQPPVIRLLTTKAERRIRMPQTKEVSKTVKIAFPIVAFILIATIAPGGLPLFGMLFFGNLLRESLVTDRLAKTAQGSFIDIITILLGVTVGAKTSAPNFLSWNTLKILLLGLIAFTIATAAGVLFAKLMNLFSKVPLNPMIGAAGVSAVPMSARVVHKMGLEEDPQNFLLMHAMGPNVAGVIGSAVAAGVMLSSLSGTP